MVVVVELEGIENHFVNLQLKLLYLLVLIQLQLVLVEMNNLVQVKVMMDQLQVFLV